MKRSCKSFDTKGNVSLAFRPETSSGQVLAKKQ